MGKVFLIASGKGGTGKSIFASNMGALLASRGNSVVLVDMDMGLRTLDIYIDVYKRQDTARKRRCKNSAGKRKR